MVVNNLNCNYNYTKHFQADFAKLVDDIQDSWNNLGGNDMIDSFEKKWCEWSIDDTIEWFEFVLNMKNLGVKDDDEIEYYSSSDDDDEDDNKVIINDHDIAIDDKMSESNIDFEHVKSRLFAMQFNCKKDLPMILKSFQFKKFGFNNKQHCQLLCKNTKLLIDKYPKKHKKPKNQNKKNVENKDDNGNKYVGLEGFVENTN